MQLCPCGSGSTYTSCCGRYIDDGVLPDTPEQLMRSRYTAYTQANIPYISQTMKGPALNGFNSEEALVFAKTAHWEKLEIIKTTSNDSHGFVEFRAHFNINGQPQILHERSEFKKENTRWYYIDGTMPKSEPLTKTINIGRNDPCLCGSGKKYKKCCG